jgi:hypothetical protein
MTAGPKTPAPSTGNAPSGPLRGSQFAVLLKLPGLAAISVYMIFLAGMNVVSVVNHHADVLLLVLSPFFIAGALGLLLLFRWAWALTVTGMALMAGIYFYGFATQHAPSSLVQGLLNLLFFFYLVRTEVREKLK